MPRTLPTLLLLAAALILASACAPKAKTLEGPIVGQLRQGMKEGSASFDHAAFDALLGEVVREDAGRVDYAALAKKRAQLDAYLTTIASADLTKLGEREQQALLINAYNGYTLSLILEHYPGIDSIRDLKKPWKTKRHEVGGHTLSLDDIEHGLLRPLYRDERVHFAVNCASIGCPTLRAEAYTGARLDEQLEAAARATLSSERHVRVEGGKLLVTSILDWYGGDFTSAHYKGHADSLPAYVARYTRDEVRDFIDSKGGAPPVGFLAYDWDLNDVER